jgi:hypothetical protein
MRHCRHSYYGNRLFAVIRTTKSQAQGDGLSFFLFIGVKIMPSTKKITEEHKWQDDITRWKKEAQIKTLESQIEELRRNLK